jgi:hypothetical protein
MKLALVASLFFLISGPVLAANANYSGKARVADATSDRCVADCASQDASCRRVCPTTFNTPCLSSCDSQAQTCRQSCRSGR